MLVSRKAEVLKAWLRGHPGVEIACRDGSGAYGEAVRRALPGAVQVGDRWHLWHSLGEAVLKEVAAHSSCWAAAGPPLNDAGSRREANAARNIAFLSRWLPRRLRVSAFREVPDWRVTGANPVQFRGQLGDDPAGRGLGRDGHVLGADGGGHGGGVTVGTFSASESGTVATGL